MRGKKVCGKMSKKGIINQLTKDMGRGSEH